MSFPKAKLLRFNEVKSCAPPPGAYNPKYVEPVVGAVISLSERFVDLKSPASASTCSDNHSVCSVNSMPTFRTPSKPVMFKKKIALGVDDKKKLSKGLFSPKKSEALREKIVECLNKDATIKELETQIDEMKSTIVSLRDERARISTEKDNLLKENVEKKEKELTEMENKYCNEIVVLKEEFEKLTLENRETRAKNKDDMMKLRNNLDLLEKFHQNERKVIEDKLSETELNYQNLQSEYTILQTQLKDLKDVHDELIASHESEIKSLNKLHESEVQDLEYELLKVVTEWRKIVENLEQENQKKTTELTKAKQEIGCLNESYVKQISLIKIETDAEIKQALENCCEKMKLMDIQMEEKCKEIEMDCSQQLKQNKEKSEEILRECQAISEYSIIQCELEKKEIEKQLREELRRFESENIKLQEIICKLKSEMSGIIIELNETRNELGKERQVHENDLVRSRIEKHSYQVTLSKTHETMDLLKTRLLNSDRDVEQLKLELETKETSLLHSENNIILLKDLLQDLEVERVESRSQVTNVEKQLLEKVELLQIKYNEKINELSKFAEDRTKQLMEVMEQLHDQQSHIVSARSLLSAAEVKNDELQRENDVLRNSSLNQDHVVNQKIQHKMDDVMLKMKQKDDEIENLKRMINEQDALIGPYREQLEMYNRENQILLTGKTMAEQEIKEISLKYAEILGHQNKKQKIKYMVDLKKKNFELQEAKIENEEKLYKQSLQIDNLKHEIRLLQSKKNCRRSRSLITIENKENLSPMKISSTTSQNSPLRERN